MGTYSLPDDLKDWDNPPSSTALTRIFVEGAIATAAGGPFAGALVFLSEALTSPGLLNATGVINNCLSILKNYYELLKDVRDVGTSIFLGTPDEKIIAALQKIAQGLGNPVQNQERNKDDLLAELACICKATQVFDYLDNGTYRLGPDGKPIAKDLLANALVGLHSPFRQFTPLTREGPATDVNLALMLSKIKESLYYTKTDAFGKPVYTTWVGQSMDSLEHKLWPGPHRTVFVTVYQFPPNIPQFGGGPGPNVSPFGWFQWQLDDFTFPREWIQVAKTAFSTNNPKITGWTYHLNPGVKATFKED